MIDNSNYPPGVSGNEDMITGGDDPLEFDDFYTALKDGQGEPWRLESIAELRDWLNMVKGMRTSVAEIHGHEMAHDVAESRIWSIVDPMDDVDVVQLYALPGVHYVNVLYYIVSAEPVRPEHADAEFLY